VKTLKYDLVVVGAGSGGYAAARTARDLGATVAMVDHGPLGGLCILRGCMPSKTLIASSNVAQDVRDGGELGIHTGAPHIDLAQIQERKRGIIKGFTDYRVGGIQSFPTFNGDARFLSPTTLAVGDEVVLEGKNFVIGTGSSIAPAIVPGLEETGFIDSDEALELAVLPKSMVVLGGGYVAAELGQYFARLGVDVTMIIRARHLFSGEDKDVGDAITLYFRSEGIKVETSAQLSRVERRGAKKVVYYSHEGQNKSVEADEIFYALGRLPNVAGLDLEKAEVTYHAVSGIEIGEDIRTSNPHIFAVGDVTGRFPLVHVAIYQGEIAARNAVTGGSEKADYSLQKTHTIFTEPQVAIAGESEKELTAAGIPYLVSSYLFSDHGKAIAIGKTKGFVKLMASPVDGKLLGGAIVGPEASDLIHEILVALFYGGTVYDLMKIPHLHPTLAEIITYPAEDIAAQIAQGAPQIAAAV
jgi:pyruvate/2-oxoglutarate dehydrogenase complex dihydrolipoamide dehydrogenase (E3) component